MQSLHTTQAKALQQLVLLARKALDEAHEKYQRALAVSMDVTEASERELRAMRAAGRDYANALTQYTNATMAWLSYADKHLRPKKAGSEEAH